jgi:hypothetical protein
MAALILLASTVLAKNSSSFKGSVLLKSFDFNNTDPLNEKANGASELDAP